MVARRPIVRADGVDQQLPAGDVLVNEAFPSNLSALAALVGAANKIAYFTAPGAMNLADFTVFARLWCALADAGAGRTLLGLGTAATMDATTSATDTTSERLWRTNDLVKQTSNVDATAGSVLLTDAWGLGATASILVTNLNTLTNTGFYAAATSAVGHPNGTETIMLSHQQGVSGIQRSYQRAIGLVTGNSYSRKQLDGVWSAWVTDWNSGNLIKQTATTDAVAGRVLLTGAHGWGSSGGLANSSGNADDVTVAGWLWLNLAATGKPAGTSSGLLFTQAATSATTLSQWFYESQSTGTPELYWRQKNVVNSTWKPWVQIWHSENLIKQTSLTDTTVGSVQLNGAHGNGGQIIATEVDFDNYKTGGRYVTPASGLVNLPSGWEQGRHILDVSGGVNYTSQTIRGGSSNIGRKASRTWNGLVWDTWRETWSTFNFDPTLKANLSSPVFTGGIEAQNVGANLATCYRTTNVANVAIQYKNTVSALYAGAAINSTTDRLFGIGASLDLNAAVFKFNVNTGIATINGNAIWHAGTFDPALKTNNTKTVTTRSATSYTFVITDDINVYNRFTNAGASTCTVPPNSSVAFPIGHVIPIRRAAAANLTLTPGTGVTLNAPSGGTLVMTDRMTVELIKVDTDIWDVVGQTVAV